MKLRLPNGVASSQDLNGLIQEVHDYSKWFAHESIKKRVNAKYSSEPPVMTKDAMELLREWKTKQQLSTTSLDELANELQSYCKSAPNISITLASTPPNTLKAQLVSWCRDNISPDVLVSFQFNATILGGLVLRQGSRIYDWSFRRQILAAHDKFPEVLRSV